MATIPAADDQHRAIQQDQEAFVRIVDRLRCYGGDTAGSPACCALSERPSSRHAQQAELIAASAARLHEACVALDIPPRVEDFAQHLLRRFIRPIAAPGARTREPPPPPPPRNTVASGIVACLLASCGEHALKICFRAVCAAVVGRQRHGIGTTALRRAFLQVHEAFDCSRNRHRRRKAREGAQAKRGAAVYDHAARLSERTCGRDVSGKLRARIYLMARHL